MNYEQLLHWTVTQYKNCVNMVQSSASLIMTFNSGLSKYLHRVYIATLQFI